MKINLEQSLIDQSRLIDSLFSSLGADDNRVVEFPTGSTLIGVPLGTRLAQWIPAEKLGLSPNLPTLIERFSYLVFRKPVIWLPGDVGPSADTPEFCWISLPFDQRGVANVVRDGFFVDRPLVRLARPYDELYTAWRLYPE